MNWDDLKVFLAAARTNRMDLAAQHLAIDPSTVGRRVSRLEAALGATLFEQSRTGHSLTESGRRLLDYAEGMEQSALAASGDLTGKTGALTGYVRVSVSEAFGTWILARHLPEFHSRFPGITVDVVSSGGFLSPSKREADIAIMLARPARGPLITRKIIDYRLGLYAATSYLERRGVPLHPDELKGHTLVGFIPDLIQVPEQRLFEEFSSSLTPALRSTSINTQTAIVSAGGGIGVLPHFIGEQLAGVAAVLPEAVRIKRAFWQVVHKDVRRVARVDAFVKWMDEVFRRDHALITGPD